MEVIERISSGELKLFVFQRFGPTSYLIGPSAQQKFKVKLGVKHQCSCKSKLKANCEHVLFVLVKVLRVPKDSPLLLQDGLGEREINLVLDAQEVARQGRNGQQQDQQPKKHKFLRKKSGLDQGDEDSVDDERKRERNEDAEEPCPICMEEFKDLSKEAFYCRGGCGKNVHQQCMTVWAEHRESIGATVTCPLCRGDFQWKQQELERKQKKRRRVCHKVRCQVCHAFPIVGDRYKCLFCPRDADLCDGCYMNREAICKGKRHPFLVKSFTDDVWRSAPNPKNDCQRTTIIPTSILDLQHRQISSNDYELLLSLDFKHGLNNVQAPTLTELLLKHMKSDTEVSERHETCSSCQKPFSNNQTGKILPCCGQALHEQCAFQICSQTDHSCPACERKLYPGLNRKKVSAEKTETTASTQNPQLQQLGTTDSDNLNVAGLSITSDSSATLNMSRPVQNLQPNQARKPKTTRIRPRTSSRNSYAAGATNSKSARTTSSSSSSSSQDNLDLLMITKL